MRQLRWTKIGRSGTLFDFHRHHLHRSEIAVVEDLLKLPCTDILVIDVSTEKKGCQLLDEAIDQFNLINTEDISEFQLFEYQKMMRFVRRGSPHRYFVPSRHRVEFMKLIHRLFHTEKLIEVESYIIRNQITHNHI